MAAQAIEAQLLGLAALVFQKRKRRHGADGFGIVILIECATQIKRFTIQVEAAFACFNVAEAEMLLPFIHPPTMAVQACAQMIEIWCVG